MDKNTTKLMKNYGVTDEMLNNSIESITIDVTGCREEIEDSVKSLELSLEDLNVRNAGGGENVLISGAASSIVTLLQMIQAMNGSGFNIVVTTLAGVGVAVTVKEAIGYIIKKTKEKHGNKV